MKEKETEKLHWIGEGDVSVKCKWSLYRGTNMNIPRGNGGCGGGGGGEQLPLV
jgi:hypothetical protein